MIAKLGDRQVCQFALRELGFRDGLHEESKGSIFHCNRRKWSGKLQSRSVKAQFQLLRYVENFSSGMQLTWLETLFRKCLIIRH